MTPHRIQRALRRKEEILRSAAHAFRRKGFHGATMDDISTELLMTPGSLYYYFKDKDEILYQCHAYSLEKVLALLAEVQGSGKPADQKLHALIRRHVSVMIDDLQASAMALEFSSLPRPLLEKVIAGRDQYERGFRAILEEGMAASIFSAGDPKLLSFAILGAINWIARWFTPGEGATEEEVGKIFADYFVAGLKAQTRRAGRPSLWARRLRSGEIAVPLGASSAPAPESRRAEQEAGPSAGRRRKRVPRARIPARRRAPHNGGENTR